MNYATIKKFDVANGPGVRVSLFVSGCRHRCPGCFNREAWDFSYGAPFTEAIQQEILQALSPSYIRGLSLLGGEPFEPENQRELLPFLDRVRVSVPEKDVWCYSGFTLEELQGNSRGHCEETEQMLSRIDVLVDGRFEESQKDIRLRFRGSENQRILDLAATLRQKKNVFWNSGEENEG